MHESLSKYVKKIVSHSIKLEFLVKRRNRQSVFLFVCVVCFVLLLCFFLRQGRSLDYPESFYT